MPRFENGKPRTRPWRAPAIQRLFRTLATLLLLPLAPALAQWDTQSPMPTHLDVRGVGAPTTSHVFIATEDDFFDDGGALFESSDGGTTWVQRAIPVSLGDGLNGMFFLDDQNGWVYGNDNYRTTDGGTTWTQLPFLGSTYFMEFYTPTFGLASGNFDRFVSHDGGDSWVASPNDIFALDFADATVGLGIADTGIYRTTDGGAGFSQVATGNAVAVAYLSTSVAVAIVDDTFLRSTDGGATWTTGASALGRTTLFAASAGVALAWGQTGSFPDYDVRVLRTSDGGETWADLGEVIPEGVLAMSAPDAQTISASDLAGNMYHSSDVGQSWTQVFSSPNMLPSFFNQLNNIRPVFADALTGYFGYGNGFVIKTTDGGASWAQISSGTGQSLDDVDRFANGDLIAVGENGTLLTSAGGTAPWIIHEAFAQADLMAIDILSATEALVVDEQGQLYTTTDGGATWTATGVPPGGLSPAEDLAFTSLLDGWVIGSGFASGALFHTTDGGNSWTPVPDFAGAYKSIDVEGSSLWAANVGGRYYRSTDDGATWTVGELPSALQVQDMDFIDAARGYAVGWWGYAARSDDGGQTWQQLPTPNSDDHLTDLHVLNANELWASTNSGVAYYSATAGMSWSVLDPEAAGFGNFSAITAVPGGDAWMVGFQGAIEHFTGPPPPPVNQPPTAAFDFVATGLSVDFTDMSTDADGTVVSWFWEFGDGATSTEQHPSHTYPSANTYIARLTVTDDDGDTGQGGALIVVQPQPGGTFGDFTEVTPIDPLFVTPQDEDFWVASTAPADYDNDGDLDVAVFGFYVVYNQSVEDRLVLFRNDGELGPGEWEFAYVDVPIGSLSSGASDLAWGDVDDDGDQDLVVGSDAQTVLYKNDAGTLVLTDTTLPPYWEDNDQADFDLRSITWADYDNDGDQDLLLPSVYDSETFSFRTALMRNDGPNGTGGFLFTEAVSPFAATAHAQSAWADYDGDEDLDLLLVNLAPLTPNGFIRRYRNDGGGVFVGEDILGTLTVEHGEVQWGDADSDGDLDVLVAGNIGETDGTYTNGLRIYRNDAETFVRTDVLSCLGCDGWFDLTASTWADYDSDGDIDILLTGSYNSGSQIEGRARIYRNDGGTFVDSGSNLPAPRASGSRGGTFSWLDLDGDADLDYFIAGEYFVPGGNGLIEAQMHAYRNDAEGQNAAPTEPRDLAAVVDEGARAGATVSLSWTAATDDHTPAAALTYDLEVYRNGAPLVNPHRLPQPGSISAATEWVLSGLPSGSYTWKLRAVDSAYNGGSVALGSFAVGPIVPVEPTPAAPRVFAFDQNVPNPFNPSTTFHFSLPERAHVTLSVFDPQGRLVTRLVDETRTPGVHAVRWQADGLASGTYFVRLEAGTFREVRRVQLLK